MSFLSDILARKRDEVAARRAAAPDAELVARFTTAMTRASPSAGAIDAGLDAA